AEDKAPLADVRMSVGVSAEGSQLRAKAFGSAALLENGANVMELSLDGEELSAANVNGPLQIGVPYLTAKNFFWRHVPQTASAITQPFSGAKFRKPRPRLVQLFADGEGGRELPIAVAGRKARVSVLCKFAD